MRLTQIKLAGFKSFVEPTIIPTPSQLVGIVGPNGCGKSNIVDAVRWVLGESRASELRGESMQDVIFNGSANRRPSARVSVELVFDNSAGRATGQWGAYSEIALRRILTREGGSTYYLNGQQVRRRDVYDLFMGTGLGARGYAIIGQGMINRLIEARPEELRVFLEEAAGVSRYKERRRETENRLSDARENLVRIDDVLRELTTQLEKLESQAGVASQYHALQHEGEQKQQALWLVKERQAMSEQHKKAQAIEQAQTELEKLTADLRATEASLETRRQAHYAAADLVHAAQGKVFEASAQVSRLETEIRHVVESRRRVQARRQQLQTQLEEWAEQETHCTEQLNETRHELDTAIASAEEERMLAEHALEQLPELEERVRLVSGSREEIRTALAHIEQDMALFSQAQRDTERQLAALAQRQERLRTELNDATHHDPALLQTLQADQSIIESQLAQAQQRLLECETRLPALEQTRQSAQGVARAEADRLSRLEAHRAALMKVQDDVQKQDGIEPWLEKLQLSGLAPLWQTISIEPGWETALEAVLSDRIDAIELNDLDQLAMLNNDPPPSRLSFYQIRPDGQHDLSEAVAGLTPLAVALRIVNGDLRSLLARWLDHVYSADSLAEALSMRAKLPSGGMLVIKEGHRIERDSVRFYAPDSGQSGVLVRQQEIDNLKLEIRAGQRLEDSAVQAVNSADQAWQELGSALATARQTVGELTQRLYDIRLTHAHARQRALQAEENATRLHEELEDVAIQVEEALIRREESLARRDELEVKLSEQQAVFAEAQQSGETLAGQADEARQRLRERERAVHEAEFAERTLRARITELERNRELAIAQAYRVQTDMEALQLELFELDDSATQAGLQEALGVRAEQEATLNAARIELDTLATELRQTDQARIEREHSLEPLRAQITALQLDEQAARLAVEQHAGQLQSHDVNRDSLGRLLEAQPETWQSPSWLQSEVQRIARRIESLGPVNLAALEELNSARERRSFLDAQHQDLCTAVDTLEDAIRKIDKETRQLLQQTFNAVNMHFGELFPRLFGGGQAQLTMTGDEILDTGIQVMAQPPGKRNSTIHLLSGGEKALTAIALVFALFKLNPAPFCLLDEVDAPLDDANTERYANLVSSMSDQTQFFFVSHNKIAMQMAKQLIGVTMQEQGVSRVVAVDIDSAVQLAEL